MITGNLSTVGQLGEMSTLQPIKTSKEAIPEQVATQILELIAAHRLEAGSRLPSIEHLAAQLQVSQSSVREAIKLIDAWGAVVVRHGAGVFVAESMQNALTIPLNVSANRSSRALLNLHQLRAALEPDIAAIAAVEHQPEHLLKLKRDLHEMDQVLVDPEAYIKADMDFHTALAESTGNDLFLIVIHPIIDLMEEGKRLASRSPGMLERAQDFHKRIYQHVKSRSAQQAREAMRLHLKQSWREIQSQAISGEPVELKHIGKGALSDHIVHHILDMISINKLEERSRLPSIEDLSKKLGVSRTSLREAIKLLEAWGVVTVRHGVGVFVAESKKDSLKIPLRVSMEWSEKAIHQLHQLRQAMEPEIAAIASKNARSKHMRSLAEAIQEMDQSIDDPDRFIMHDLVFHSNLAEATGNNLFLIVIHSVVDLLQDVRNLAISNTGASERAQKYHVKILEEIKAGNPVGARITMQAHMIQTWSEIQASMSS